MRRSGRCVVVGAVLLSLALFNIYSTITIYNQHACSRSGEKIVSTRFGNGENSQVQNGAQGAEIQLPEHDTHSQHKSNRVESKMSGVANRWLHRGWERDDQMVGLVAPPEPRQEVPGQLGVEGVHRHHPHHDHRAPHDLLKNMTLFSEMNGTLQEWPWPNAVKTYQKCEQKKWGPAENMPDVSVIISFHEQESLSHLLRTVHSLVQRTPRVLLKQIVLVADNTHKDELGDVLDVYIKTVFGEGLVDVIRSKVHLGVIRARQLGVLYAKGAVLVVMDSHMEVQHHWLEPLLYEIMQDRGTIATSFLDWFEALDNGRWKYRHGDSSWITYFDWAFTFGFQELGSSLDKRKDVTEAVRSPITIGGMFAIEKKFFQEIGSFDDGMTKWGGENMDLSFRVWLCGGRVVNVPCSHAAHFESATSRSYRDSWTADRDRNYQRIAEVWLGPYKKYFYENYPHLKNKDPGDLSSRLNIKKKCKRSFNWLLQNVTPQLGIPDRDSIAYGGVECLGFNDYCLDSRDLRHPGLGGCLHTGIQSQDFYWSLKGTLRMPIHMVNVLPPSTTEDSIILEENTRLYNSSKGTIWFHVKDGFIIDTKTGKCLHGELTYKLSLQPCDPDNKRQRWRFRSYNTIYFQMVNSEPLSGIDSTILNKYSQYMHLAQKKLLKHKERNVDKNSWNDNLNN